MKRLESFLQELKTLGAKILQFPFDMKTYPKKFPPTLLLEIPWTSSVMKEEIFGPLLPIFSYKDQDQILQILHNQEKPLAMYIFSQDDDFCRSLLKKTSCGGVCINDVLIHLANPHLPFGGIGQSGMGNYHGFHGFLTFSHSKSVFQQAPWDALRLILYPPAANLKLKVLHWMARLF